MIKKYPESLRMNHISDVHFWKVNVIERTFHDCEPHRVLLGPRVCSEILKYDSIAHTKFRTNRIGPKKRYQWFSQNAVWNLCPGCIHLKYQCRIILNAPKPQRVMRMGKSSIFSSFKNQPQFDERWDISDNHDVTLCSK